MHLIGITILSGNIDYLIKGMMEHVQRTVVHHRSMQMKPTHAGTCLFVARSNIL